MTQIAIPWLIYDLTHSVFLLGLAGFLGFLPTLVITPFSGTLADRWSKHSLLNIVQVMGISISLTLTVLTFLGQINFWSLLILSILAGMVKGLDMPVRHAFVIDMVPNRADLGNAIALNSMLLSSSRFIGPALGGILIATVGIGFCFLYDTLSYLGAILALAAMQLSPKKVESQTDDTWQKLREGFNYVLNFSPIRCILLLLMLHSLVGMSYMTLLPIFAADILQKGPEAFGFLSATTAVGSVFACIYLSLRRSIVGLEQLIALCPASMGICLIAFSLSKEFWISALILVVIGGSGTLQIACSNTAIQSIVEDSKRGRVMGFYTLSLVGITPFGNLLAGSLASQIGAPNTLVVCGIVSILGAGLFTQQLPLLAKYLKLGVSTGNPSKTLS